MPLGRVLFQFKPQRIDLVFLVTDSPTLWNSTAVFFSTLGVLVEMVAPQSLTGV